MFAPSHNQTELGRKNVAGRWRVKRRQCRASDASPRNSPPPEVLSKPCGAPSTPREKRVGRGLRSVEFPNKTHLLSPALSSIRWRRGRRLACQRCFERASPVSEFGFNSRRRGAGQSVVGGENPHYWGCRGPADSTNHHLWWLFGRSRFVPAWWPINAAFVRSRWFLFGKPGCRGSWR